MKEKGKSHPSKNFNCYLPFESKTLRRIIFECGVTRSERRNLDATGFPVPLCQTRVLTGYKLMLAEKNVS